jgi:hypothetical protein
MYNHMNNSSLKQAHNKLLDEGLYEVREDEPVLAEIVSYRLIIERLGEKDNNYWWDSQVLSEFGGESVSEITPKTTPKRRVELAQKVGKKVEKERLPDGSVSLFDITPRVENRIEEVIASTDIGSLDTLESINMKLNDPGWSDEMVPANEEVRQDTEIRLGGVDTEDMNSDRGVESVVHSLVSAYGQSTENNLRIPYYVREG